MQRKGPSSGAATTSGLNGKGSAVVDCFAVSASLLLYVIELTVCSHNPAAWFSRPCHAAAGACARTAAAWSARAASSLAADAVGCPPTAAAEAV